MISGIPMIFINLLALIGISWLFVWVIEANIEDVIKVIIIVADILLFVINCIFWGGFMQIEPNEARVMLFFGKYNGTVKENGFFWVNPFYAKKRLTLRARNLDAAPIKVNDKAGNPQYLKNSLTTVYQ